jgi:hypothetical protein
VQKFTGATTTPHTLDGHTHPPITCQNDKSCLHLEARGSATATCTLELAALGRDAWLGLGAWRARVAEEAVRLAGGAARTQQNGSSARGGLQRQLIERDNLTACLHDASTSAFRDTQSAHTQRWDAMAVQSHIISDSANDHGDLISAILHVTDQTVQTNGRAVRAGLNQALQHDFIEARTRAARQETVQLQDSKPQTIKQEFHESHNKNSSTPCSTNLACA